MIVVVCGSRGWTDRDAINRRVATLPPGSIVIQGGATGADVMARHAAALANLHCAENATGRCSTCDPISSSRFRRDGSRGTQGTIDEARRRGIDVEVHKA